MQGYLRVLGIVVASPHSKELAAGRGSGFFLLHLQFDFILGCTKRIVLPTAIAHRDSVMSASVGQRTSAATSAPLFSKHGQQGGGKSGTAVRAHLKNVAIQKRMEGTFTQLWTGKVGSNMPHSSCAVAKVGSICSQVY